MCQDKHLIKKKDEVVKTTPQTCSSQKLIPEGNDKNYKFSKHYSALAAQKKEQACNYWTEELCTFSSIYNTLNTTVYLFVFKAVALLDDHQMLKNLK